MAASNGTRVRDRVASQAAAPVPQQQKRAALRDLVQQQREQIARALPATVRPERFVRAVLTEMRRTPALNGCTPESFLGGVMQGAQLGLEFGPLGHAYLIPFRNNRRGVTEAQFLIGYKGMLSLARRSGDIISIVARPFHQNDQFEFEYGTAEKLTHRPAMGGRGEVVGYYGVAILQGGGQVIEVMSRDDIEKRRARSKARDDGPWATDYDAMAAKTVVRKMFPWLPVSTEAAEAVANDEGVIRFDGVDLVADHDLIDVEAEAADPEPGDGAATADAAATEAVDAPGSGPVA